MRRALGLLAILLASAIAVPAAALDASDPPTPREMVERADGLAEGIVEDPGAAVRDPGGAVDQVLAPDGPDDGDGADGPAEERDPGFADRIREAFEGEILAVGVAGLGLTLVGLGGFAFVTRYISPKEALKNPQRAMLYGFVRGNPGVHLKRLSEEFAMKTSSILWHIRKLESAELVHSERANGFRVFYPVEGGIEIKRVSRALAALQNRNARALFEAVERRPGASAPELAQRVAVHAGTVRWHLRKLRDYGLLDETVRADGSSFYATPLGRRALETLLGSPVPSAVAGPAPAARLAVPTLAEA